jgi:hypothetical protein
MNSEPSKSRFTDPSRLDLDEGTVDGLSKWRIRGSIGSEAF